MKHLAAIFVIFALSVSLCRGQGSLGTMALQNANNVNITGGAMAGTFTGNLTGNADTVTTNANLNGAITSVGNTTSLGSFSTAQFNSALNDNNLGTAAFTAATAYATAAQGATADSALQPNGNGSLLTGITATQVGLGNVTNDAQTKAAIVPNTVPSAGQIMVGNAGGTAYAAVSASGDLSLAPTGAFTLVTVNGNTGNFGSATQAATFTVNGKGQITAASNVTITPAIASITGLGANVAGALAIAVGAAGSFAVKGAEKVTLTSSGTDTFAGTAAVTATSYVEKDIYVFTADTANTGTASLNVDGLGAKTIVKVQGGITTTLADNDIRSGQVVVVAYDGTNFQIISELGFKATFDLFTFVIDGGGSVPSTGLKKYFPVREACTITEYELIVTGTAGSIVFDIWNEVDPYDGSNVFDNPPTDADSITASAPPTLSSQQGKISTTFTGWNTSLPARSMGAINVDSISTLTNCTLILRGTKNQ